MSDVRDHLQSALGSAYTLERELGGGGMSRVFVALEHALGRRVVIKVLAPELAAGEAAGMPFYTMPTWNALSARRPRRRCAMRS